MKIGFVTDAHGNPFGLNACIERLNDESVDRIYFLGDAVGYWPHAERVLVVLDENGIDCIQGNHEAMLIGSLPIPEAKDRLYRLEKLKEIFPEKAKQRIQNWPLSRSIVCNQRRILVVHGRPNNPLQGYVYENDCLTENECGSMDVIVMGHTHCPYVKEEGGRLIINAGSCGLPRDRGALASCAIYDVDSHRAAILRVAFDGKTLIDSCPKSSIAKEVVDCLTR